MVGPLSSLYSTAFNLATLKDGQVVRLRHEPAPGALSALVPEDYWSRADRVLPLWQFEVRPSVGPHASEAAASSEESGEA